MSNPTIAKNFNFHLLTPSHGVVSRTAMYTIYCMFFQYLMAYSNHMNTITLITGATSGIGLELSRLAAKDGKNLVIVARNTEQLASTAAELRSTYKVSVTPLAKDLSKPESATALYAEIEKQGLSVEVLINNAGFATHGLFAESDPEFEMDMLETNIKSLVHLTRLVLPDMITRKQGHILNLASTAAFQPGPLMAGYYASKAFVLSFGEALANELAGSGVTITTLCPGPTKTNFAERARVADGKLFQGMKVMDAAYVAKIGYEAMQRGKAVVIPGHTNTLMTIATRFAPRGLAAVIARRVQEGE
jgi:short-subunit dehydrogenase